MTINEEKLVKMLKYVSEHNDFYKNRIREYGIKNPLDITQWPILTRRELQENRYDMFSDGYKSKYFDQQLRRQSSSGTSGMPVNVYWDYKDWYASNMCLWRKRLEWYGIKPSDRYCNFTLNAFGITPERVGLKYINDPKNILSFNVSLVHDKNGYEQIAKAINSFEPDWLYIQPFVLNQLIRAYENTGLVPPKSIRYIESVGEVLTSDLRERAKKCLCVPVTNLYGSEEMNGIAYECPDHCLRVLEENVFLEVKNRGKISTEGEGDIIITSLHNMAMPLIRYNQNDVVKISSSCNCTNGAYVISDIIGRQIQEIVFKGKLINAFALAEVIAVVNNRLDDVIESYQFVYSRSNEKLLCKLVLAPARLGWFSSAQIAIVDILREKFDICINSSDIIKQENETIYSVKQRTVIIEE